MFTKPDLAKLVGPVLPNPVSDTSAHQDGNSDGEEDTPCRWTVLLFELVAMSGASQGFIKIHLEASLASRQCEAAVASWSVILDLIGIKSARLSMIGRVEAGNEFTGPVDSALVVVVAKF